MLDGLLGRGFSVKCKSLIKATRARIEVVRRRAVAKQRFLKEDLVKLLSNGLDINAYGRTEEFLAGMNLLSCYDFVEQFCDYIVKQLSRMQKQGECPEDCREAVGSVMFAAARFSDMPELRDLRDIFQQRYGSCLEAFVNQKFVEKLSSRPPETEKKLQVLQDIASEFSIRWDSRGFEQRMTAPSIVAQAEVRKTDTAKPRPGPLDEKSRIRSFGEGKNVWRRDETDHHIPQRKDTIEYKDQSLLKRGGSSSRGDNNVLYRARHILTENKHPFPVEKGDVEMKVEKSSSSSHGKMLDKVHAGYMRPNNGACDPRQGERTEALFREKEEYDPRAQKDQEEGSDKLKSCSSYALPPPYVKSKDNMARPPYVKPKEDKDRHSKGSKHAASDQAEHAKHAASDQAEHVTEHVTDPSSCNRSNFVNSSGRPGNEPDHHDHEEQFVATSKVKNYGHENEDNYQDEKFPLPKPRSIRRKHHKSSSNYNVADTVEDVGAVNRSSSSRRKDHSRKGLHILFDEEHSRKDDEERMIDKLLIHYSKKPTTYDAGKLRKKLPVHPSHEIIADVGESSLDPRRDAHDGKYEAVAVPHPTRSLSLPYEQTASPETKKVLSRAKTFQLDNQARHVHPKLPDYDDLAARFAALKGR